MRNINISIKLPKNISFTERCNVFKIISMFVYYKPNDMIIAIESIDINSVINIIISYNESVIDHVSQKRTTHVKYLKSHIFIRRKIKGINKNIELIIKFNTIKDPEYVMNKIEQYFSLPRGYLNINTNRRDVVEKRQIAHFISKNAGFSLNQIGKTIGHRDHSTVLHSCKVISNLLETNRKFKNEFDILNKTI